MYESQCINCLKFDLVQKETFNNSLLVKSHLWELMFMFKLFSTKDHSLIWCQFSLAWSAWCYDHYCPVMTRWKVSIGSLLHTLHTVLIIVLRAILSREHHHPAVFMALDDGCGDTWVPLSQQIIFCQTHWPVVNHPGPYKLFSIR